jgi:hypothetical protein
LTAFSSVVSFFDLILNFSFFILVESFQGTKRFLLVFRRIKGLLMFYRFFILFIGFNEKCPQKSHVLKDLQDIMEEETTYQNL